MTLRRKKLYPPRRAASSSAAGDARREPCASGMAKSTTSLKILSAGAVKYVVTGLVPEFTRDTGCEVDCVFGTIADVRKRLSDGETADLVIGTTPAIAQMERPRRPSCGSTWPRSSAPSVIVPTQPSALCKLAITSPQPAPYVLGFSKSWTTTILGDPMEAT